MTNNLKNLLANNGLELAEQISIQRLKRAGVTLGKDLGLKKLKRTNTFPRKLIEKLAGG